MPITAPPGSGFTPAVSGASMTDMLTALKNVVTAINNQTSTNVTLAGQRDFWGLTTATVVSPNPGRIVRVSVIVAGSAVGHIYDTATLGDTSRPIYVIPMTAGVTLVDIPTQYGILVVPGTGQTVSGSFS